MAGVLAGPILSVDPNMAFELLIIIFVVIIFGGLGSLGGVVISGIIIGEVIAFGTALMTGMVAKILAFAVMIAILIIKPLGLFGRARFWSKSMETGGQTAWSGEKQRVAWVPLLTIGAILAFLPAIFQVTAFADYLTYIVVRMMILGSTP